MPAAAAAALSEKIRDEPATRSGSRSPVSRVAQTSGIPSATTSVACRTSARAAGSRVTRRQMSMLGVTTQPPWPPSRSATMRATTWASASASKSSPASRA
ncbi:MAG: hypothetical protein WAK82_41280, partial [Streptosporangiaceae bacterium]